MDVSATVETSSVSVIGPPIKHIYKVITIMKISYYYQYDCGNFDFDYAYKQRDVSLKKD